jgi:hypothetical protein
MYERLRLLAGESRTEARLAYKAGEAIPTGSRRETIFSLALEQVRDGVPHKAIATELLRINASQASHRSIRAKSRNRSTVRSAGRARTRPRPRKPAPALARC